MDNQTPNIVNEYGKKRNYSLLPGMSSVRGFRYEKEPIKHRNIN